MTKFKLSTPIETIEGAKLAEIELRSLTQVDFWQIGAVFEAAGGSQTPEGFQPSARPKPQAVAQYMEAMTGLLSPDLQKLQMPEIQALETHVLSQAVAPACEVGRPYLLAEPVTHGGADLQEGDAP